MPAETWTLAERRELLDRAVTTYAQHGYTVRSRTDTRAVVARRQRVSVLWNLVLAVLTGGLWLVVLGVRLLNWPLDTVTLRVDEYGEIVPEFTS